jgi:hypothetical protein
MPRQTSSSASYPPRALPSGHPALHSGGACVPCGNVGACLDHAAAETRQQAQLGGGLTATLHVWSSRVQPATLHLHYLPARRTVYNQIRRNATSKVLPVSTGGRSTCPRSWRWRKADRGNCCVVQAVKSMGGAAEGVLQLGDVVLEAAAMSPHDPSSSKVRTSIIL